MTGVKIRAFNTILNMCNSNSSVERIMDFCDVVEETTIGICDELTEGTIYDFTSNIRCTRASFYHYTYEQLIKLMEQMQIIIEDASFNVFLYKSAMKEGN